MNHSQFKLNPLAVAVTGILTAGLLLQTVNAATRTWDGNGANDNWGYVDSVAFNVPGNTNWTDFAFSHLPVSGDSLIFQGTTRLTPFNNLISQGVSGITFAEGAGAFTLNGNIVSSTGNIINLSGNTQTINMQLYVAADQTWDGAGNAGTTGLLNVNKLQMGNATLTLQRQVAISNLTSDFIVGYADQSTLIVRGGSTIKSAKSVVGQTTKGSVSIDGTGSSWTNSADLFVGYQGNGAVSVNNGGTLTNTQGWIGFSAGSLGAATVDGLGSTWSNSKDLVVGASGNGALNVKNGGVATNAYGLIGHEIGSSGAATVTGEGASWINSADLYIGNKGNGTLNVQNHGTVNNKQAFIGYSSGSSSAAVVDGIGSSWSNTQDLFVGHGGNGTLNVNNGGTLTNTQGWIGTNAGSLGAATIDGNRSSWSNSKDLVVGDFGNGTLKVQNGGVVKNVNGLFADETGSLGTAIVEGKGASWINSADLHVGNKGNGTLNIQNRGTVNNAQGFIGFSVDSSGETIVDGAGSTWNNSQNLVVGNRGNGTLFVNNGGAVSNQMGVIGNQFNSSGEVRIYGAGTSWTNSGDLVVGLSGLGLLSIGSGGTVTSNNAELSQGIGSSAIVRIGGVGSTWKIHKDLQLGTVGSSLVEIEHGGSLDVGGNIDIIGMLNLLDGSLSAETVSRQFLSEFNWSSGEVSLARATIGSDHDLFGGNSFIDANKTLIIRDKIDILEAGMVTVTNTGRFNANNLDNQGILNIGANGQVAAAALVNTGSIINRGNLHSNSLANGGTIQLAGIGSISTDILSLDQGSISGTILNVDNIGILSGNGSVSSAIVGGNAANTIQASGGNLDLGSTNAANGFDFGGKLEVGSNQVTLLDKDKAQLGVSTSLANGGKLSSINGIDLGDHEALGYTGNASIWGNFTNNGEVVGSGGTLTFLNNVNGKGGYAGDIAFNGGYNPGNSPAAINFHGSDINFNSTSVLTMEIFGNTPGSQYDQLLNIDHFDFNGTLALVFGGAFTPTAGSSFNLFNFASFSGSFAPGHITVTGLDRALLDFSKLASQGSLGVAAVPLPAGVWLFGSGLMGILAASAPQSLIPVGMREHRAMAPS